MSEQASANDRSESPSIVQGDHSNGSRQISRKQVDCSSSKLIQDCKAKKSLKRKRSSPFRIKTGCVVAIRYRKTGNRVFPVSMKGTAKGIALQLKKGTIDGSSAAYSEVWADPQPGRDQGLALVGRWIRCCFPKIVVSKDFGKRANSRFLEGEIVSIVNYEEQFGEQLLSRRRRQGHGTAVELLIDKKNLADLPFLQRTDKPANGDSVKRNDINEIKIRGENKALVRVVLCDTSGISMVNSRAALEAKWVIRKRLSTKRVSKLEKLGDETKMQADEVGHAHAHRFRKEDEISVSQDQRKPKRQRMVNPARDFSAQKYVGDGNDPSGQQETNWRWQASKINPLSIFIGNHYNATIVERLSYNFIGEVIQVQAASPSEGTMAYVTIRRLLLPEHTDSGRLSHHAVSDIFDYVHSVSGPNEDCTDSFPYSGVTCYYRVAIEELVIVSRRLVRVPEGSTCQASHLDDITRYGSRGQRVLFATQIYSGLENAFIKKNLTTTIFDELSICLRCRVFSQVKDMRKTNNFHATCEECRKLNEVWDSQFRGQSFVAACDCLECESQSYFERQKDFCRSIIRVRRNPQNSGIARSTAGMAFANTCCVIKQMEKAPFGMLGFRFLKIKRFPASKPIANVKVRSPKKRKTNGLSPHQISTIPPRDTVPRAETNSSGNGTKVSAFAPSSCRLLSYRAKNGEEGIPSIDETKKTMDKQRNLRLTTAVETCEGDTDKEKVNTRAARANQRMHLRAVASIGVAVDTLSGREELLRFDRSGIHAWGVFADEDLKEGELLVEYRGEIIGNAMAEKREKEYEGAKIGSDYMFRMDGNTVCDATKQGNVARFINHSCDANCFTKVISTDGSKRIVVYAKRNIGAGDELCYDYKFPLEFDESKRIPCHCGAKDCRGFMNWDKRYAVTEGKTILDMHGESKLLAN